MVAESLEEAFRGAAAALLLLGRGQRKSDARFIGQRRLDLFELFGVAAGLRGALARVRRAGDQPARGCRV